MGQVSRTAQYARRSSGRPTKVARSSLRETLEAFNSTSSWLTDYYPMEDQETKNLQISADLPWIPCIL